MNKKHLLLIIAAGCVILYFANVKDIPYTEYLPAIGGGAYALNFLTTLAK